MSCRGFDAGAARSYLTTGNGERALMAAGAEAPARIMHLVPSIMVGDFLISGAQPPLVFAKALQRSARQIKR